MELLVIKSGADYIRIAEEEYHRCGLNKASVFPLDQLDNVREYVRQMEGRDFESVTIKKLIITEKTYKKK